MGFYIRKSISVGPLRFNLSKSGIGVSAGVKGLRFGTGPRGNYVHLGKAGLYYRATIPSSSTSPRTVLPNVVEPIVQLETHAPLEKIESADSSQIVDSSSQELLIELNQKRKKIRTGPIISTLFALVAVVGQMNAWPSWILIGTLVTGLIASYMAFSHDTLAKTVVLFYHFDLEMEQVYGQLHSAAEKLAECSAAWHIEAQGKVFNRKYHAGASSLVERKKTFVRKAEPPYVKSNIATVAMGVGSRTLHFFPDRVLIYSSNGVGAVSYPELCINVKPSRFIEDGAPPRDSKVVDRTWRYVNKAGGPDRRFKDNRELPICLYDEISLSSQSGLNEIVQVSRCDTAGAFAEAIVALAKKIPVEKNDLIAA